MAANKIQFISVYNTSVYSNKIQLIFISHLAVRIIQMHSVRSLLAKTMLTNRYVLYVPKNWRWLWFVECRTCRGYFFVREKKRRVLTKPQTNYWPHKSITLFQLKHTKESQNSMPKRPRIIHLEVSSEHKFFEHLIKQRHGIWIRCLVSQHLVLLDQS